MSQFAAMEKIEVLHEGVVMRDNKHHEELSVLSELEYQLARFKHRKAPPQIYATLQALVLGQSHAKCEAELCYLRALLKLHKVRHKLLAEQEFLTAQEIAHKTELEQLIQVATSKVESCIRYLE